MTQTAPVVIAKLCMFIASPEGWSSAGETSSGLGAIDHIHMSVEVGGVIGGEKREQCRNFFRLGVTSQRNLLVHGLKHLVRVFGALHRSQYVPRSNRVHPDFGR